LADNLDRLPLLLTLPMLVRLSSDLGTLVPVVAKFRYFGQQIDERLIKCGVTAKKDSIVA
jgi:hypothetical protein